MRPCPCVQNIGRSEYIVLLFVVLYCLLLPVPCIVFFNSIEIIFLTQVGECNSSMRLFQKDIKQVQNLFLKICIIFPQGLSNKEVKQRER